MKCKVLSIVCVCVCFVDLSAQQVRYFMQYTNVLCSIDFANKTLGSAVGEAVWDPLRKLSSAQKLIGRTRFFLFIQEGRIYIPVETRFEFSLIALNASSCAMRLYT